jgi:predicted Fe-Mo cluster-binding NifX family protein
MTHVAVNLEGDQVGAGWGRSKRIAVATLDHDHITSWDEYDVGWDIAHDAPQTTHGSHHARIVTFLRDHHIDTVICGHMGPPMANMLTKMGIQYHLGATGPAKQVVAELVSAPA